MAWYYARGDERMGPVEDADMEQLVASGAVNAQTLVWQEGMADWQPYGSIDGVAVPDTDLPASLFGEQSAQSCAECGRTFASDEMLSYENHWVCADCKDVFFQRIREGGGPLTQLRYGGFWIRFCARMIDVIILGFVSIIQSLVQTALVGSAGLRFDGTTGATDYIVAAVVWFISIAIALSYEAFFVGKYAATPGKMIFGLRVVMSDGGRVSYPRAIGRYFAAWLSYITLLIGYIIAAFDDEKRALHDHICDTRVVRK